MANANSTPYGRIYLITNTVNGKRYVGQTIVTIEKRWRVHCGSRSRCKALSAAIAKYGRESFSIAEIATAEDRDGLNALEFRYVIELGTTAPNGYNLKEGGGSKGKWSSAWIKERREKSDNPEFRAIFSASSKKMWTDPDIRARISAAIKIGLSNPEVKARRSTIATLACSSLEVRAKMSAGQKARFSNPAERKKVSEQSKARCDDPAYRKKMSDAAKMKCSDPAHRAKIGESVRALWNDPEYRARMTLAFEKARAKEKLLRAQMTLDLEKARANGKLPKVDQ